MTDNRVQVLVRMSREERSALRRIALEKDITVQDMIGEVLRGIIAGGSEPASLAHGKRRMPRNERAERRARIVEMRKAGASAKDAAAAFGVSVAMVFKAAASAGLPPSDRTRMGKRDAEILAMRRSGMTNVAIAKHFGITNQRVAQIIKKTMQSEAKRSQLAPRPAADLVSPQARQAAARRAKWLAFAQQNA